MQINDQDISAGTPEAPVTDAPKAADPGRQPGQAAVAGSGVPDRLTPALAAARELLTGTADVINPGTSPDELLGYVTQYRRRLSDLVAAYSATGSGAAA